MEYECNSFRWWSRVDYETKRQRRWRRNDGVRRWWVVDGVRWWWVVELLSTMEDGKREKETGLKGVWCSQCLPLINGGKNVLDIILTINIKVEEG